MGLSTSVEIVRVQITSQGSLKPGLKLAIALDLLRLLNRHLRIALFLNVPINFLPPHVTKKVIRLRRGRLSTCAKTGLVLNIVQMTVSGLGSLM
jgi:hypothetical protein